MQRVPGAGNVLRAVLPTLLDVVVPIAAYFVLRACGLDSFWALALGASLAVVGVLGSAVRNRRLNTAGVAVLALFAVGIAVTFLTSDARILLVKPSFFFAAIGTWLLVSCLFHRPLMYEFIRPAIAMGTAEQLERFELTWERVSAFRGTVRAMTAVWGLTWIVESAVRVVVVYSFPQERAGEALIWTLVALAGLVLPALVFTFFAGRRMTRIGREFNRRLDSGADGEPS